MFIDPTNMKRGDICRTQVYAFNSKPLATGKVKEKKRSYFLTSWDRLILERNVNVLHLLFFCCEKDQKIGVKSGNYLEVFRKAGLTWQLEMEKSTARVRCVGASSTCSVVFNA